MTTIKAAKSFRSLESVHSGSQQDQSEFALSSEHLSMAIETAGMGFWHRPADSNTIAFNAQACRIHGLCPESENKVTQEEYLLRIHPDDRERIRSTFIQILDQDAMNVEYRFAMPDGVERWILCSGFGQAHPNGRNSLVGSVFDISQRKEASEQLVSAQKMEAVGQLTAGIAHNFNNILSAILPNLHLASRFANTETKKYVRNAKLAAERASELVSELMIVAGRKRETERRTLDLPQVVERIVRICRTTFGSWVHLAYDNEDGTPAIMGNESQLEQVVLNLLINARDALEYADNSCPRIAVSLVQEANHAVIRVTDNGHGMDESTQGRIFEPFFSTKASGTGLGLATVLAIVQGHEGTVSVSSIPDMGSTIEVRLPILEVQE